MQMRLLPVAVLLSLLTACSPAEPQPDDDWRKTFEGDVIAVNDTAVRPSFRMTFYSTDGDETPERYQVSSECFDRGYFDKDRQAFLSGTSPNGQGADQMTEKSRREMAEGHRRRCPSDHPVIYNRLLDVMYEGAVLSIDGDKGRLVSQSGASISLVRVPMVLLYD